jgi:hypothetical protein
LQHIYDKHEKSKACRVPVGTTFLASALHAGMRVLLGYKGMEKAQKRSSTLRRLPFHKIDMEVPQ